MKYQTEWKNFPFFFPFKGKGVLEIYTLLISVLIPNRNSNWRIKDLNGGFLISNLRLKLIWIGSSIDLVLINLTPSTSCGHCTQRARDREPLTAISLRYPENASSNSWQSKDVKNNGVKKSLLHVWPIF